jgi:hypothetical protein
MIARTRENPGMAVKSADTAFVIAVTPSALHPTSPGTASIVIIVILRG